MNRQIVASTISPTPLKVFGRGHYACNRCKTSKVKCSGEKPTCSNCRQVGKGHLCVYPSRDRKIVIMESGLKKLQAQVKHMEDILNFQGPSTVFTNTPTIQYPMLQSRNPLPSKAADSYLLADAENDFVPYKLLMLCAHHLPSESYSRNMITLVCRTYTSEFYLVEGDQVEELVTQIYQYFNDLNSLDKSHPTALPPISPVPICHFYALLAFAEQIHNKPPDSLSSLVPNDSRRIPGKDYFSLAIKLFHLSYEQPNIQFIQSSVILGLFACNLNRYNTVYNFFGVALRSAVANGFHRRMEPPINLDADKLHRHHILEEKTKRLWWTCFVVDVIWAARINMPVHIDYTDTDVALPTEGPTMYLNDCYDAEILECNVHLVKYMAKFNRLIYGPNMRTMSVNYITTDSMSQKLLVRNILSCIDGIVSEYEDSILLIHKSDNMLSSSGRKLANLFLRYNQLVTLVVEPLFSLIFDETSTALVEDVDHVLLAISRGVAAATRTVSIFLKLYEFNKLFVLGFWDSHHLFSALMISILASVSGYDVVNCSTAVALLRYMGENNNINAKNYLQKVEVVRGYLSEMTELTFQMDWECKITDILTQRDPFYDTDDHGVFFNPFAEHDYNPPRMYKKFAPGPFLTSSLHEQLGFHNFSRYTREKLSIMAKSIQSWDNYSGLPIHLSGTARRHAMIQAQPIFETPETC